MKKLVATILTVLTCGAAYALPLGNPAEASLFLNGICLDSCGCCDPCDPCFSWCDAWGIRVGFYGDYVWNRHLERCDNNDDDDDCDCHGSDIDRTEIYTNAGYIALNICDRIDIFSSLGSTKFHIRTDATSFSTGSSLESELFFESRFSWSIGARATLWECDCFAVGIEGQYFRTCPDVDAFLRYDTGTLTYFNGDNDDDDCDCRGNYHEWQVGLGAAYRFATSCPTIAMTPYVGVTWSSSRFDHDDLTWIDVSGSTTRTFTISDLGSKKLWGFAVGNTFTLCDMVGVTVEGRFGSEKALYVNGQFRF